MKSNLVENYCLVSLNAERVEDHASTMKIKNKCIAAAVMFQIFLEHHESYALKIDGIKSMPESVKRVLNISDQSSVEISPEELLNGFKKLTQEDFTCIASIQKEKFLKCRDMEEISALLECDLNYENTGARLFEYRVNPQKYSAATAEIRKETFGAEKISDEMMLFIWLLNESQDLEKIFYDSEIEFLNEITERMCKEINF